MEPRIHTRSQEEGGLIEPWIHTRSQEEGGRMEPRTSLMTLGSTGRAP